MSWLLWAVPFAPAVFGALLACLGRRADRSAAKVAAVLAAVTVALAYWAAAARPVVEASWIGPLRAGLAVDGLSAALVLTTSLVTLSVVLFASADLGEDEARGRFFGLLLVFAGAMLATVTAATFATLIVAWEVMGATSWALIGFWWADPARPPAATTAFLVTRGADLGLYLGVAAVFAGTGTLAIAGVDRALSGPWRHVAVGGFLLAAAGKSAQLPFSGWLSAAMRGPSPVSALLHSATMVAAGAYLLLRLQPLVAVTGWAGQAAAWLGAVTAVALGIVAVGQRDLKQLLAASTCAHMGFVFIAAGTGEVEAGTAHLVAHAAFKALLFLGAGLYLHLLGTQDLRALRGVGWSALRLPTALVAIGALALAGSPPLSGWATKDAVLAGAREVGSALYAVGLVASLLSALSAGRILATLYAPVTRTAPPAVRAASVLPMAGLATVCLGWIVASPPQAGAAELAGTALVAVAGVALTWRAGPVGGETPAWSARWLGLTGLGGLVIAPSHAVARGLAGFDDRVVDAGVRASARVGGALARLSGVIDRRIVDGLVRGVAGRARGLARSSRAADDWVVDRAVEALAGAVGASGRLARRPQTGMVGQYYALAVTLLAVLAALGLIARSLS